MKTQKVDELLEAMKNAPRQGADHDFPEGARYVQVSDTLWQQIIVTVEEARKVLHDNG